MRSRLLPALLAASLSLAGAAYASTSTTGQIKALDMTASTVTLDNGIAYSLPVNFKDPGLKVGEKVQISWNIKDGKHMATRVKVEK